MSLPDRPESRKMKAALKRGVNQFLEMKLDTTDWKIEESFRILKTDLEARPVYVHTDKYIKGHFVLCYLALCLVRYTQYLVLENGMAPISAGVLNDSIETPLLCLKRDDQSGRPFNVI